MTRSRVTQYGIDDLYEPIKDYTAPDQKQVDSAMRFIRNAKNKKKPVAVSCGAGYGRTGTILACYLVSLGQTADQALSNLFKKRPCSEEILRVPEQKETVYEFEKRLKSGM